MTNRMIAPAGFVGTFIAGSGAAYTPDAVLGLVTAVSADVPDLIKAGFTFVLDHGFRNGAVGAGVTAVEYGDSYSHMTVLTLAATLGAIAGGAALGLGHLIYTLPAGNVVVESSLMNVAITQTQGHVTANTPKVGLGTTVASGVVSALSGTAAFNNIVGEMSAADCNGTASRAAAIPGTGAALLIADAGDHGIYFNAAATWTAGGDAGALVTGSVALKWTNLG